MANYPTHLKGGLASGIAGALMAWQLDMISGYGIPIVVLSGGVGGIAPDIDHDKSIPTRIIASWSALLLPSMLLWRVQPLQNPWDRATAIWIFLALFIYYPGSWLLKKISVHRGIFHSVPSAVIFGCLLYLIFGPEIDHIDLQIAMGFTGTCGYLSHLVLDEVYSVDFEGRRIKRSFGTAFTMWKNNIWTTSIAYLTLLILITLCYKDYNGTRPELLYKHHVLGEDFKPTTRPQPRFIQKMLPESLK